MRTHEDFTDNDTEAIGHLATTLLNSASRDVEPFVLLTALLTAHHHVLKQLPLDFAKTAVLGTWMYGNHLKNEFSLRQEAKPSTHTH